ncbi:MAG: hypothetical protein ACT4OF_15840 [Caulobacteraceae bacterium]
MLHWRATGRLAVMRRSAWGLHVALDCPFVDLLQRRRRDLRWAIALCTDPALADRLERALRRDDCVALGGRIERCTRKVHPIVAHKWDLIVTRWFVLGRGGVLAHALDRLARLPAR